MRYQIQGEHVILLDLTECASRCGYVLAPTLFTPDGIAANNGDSFYRAADGSFPHCLRCWGRPRAVGPPLGRLNAIACVAARK